VRSNVQMHNNREGNKLALLLIFVFLFCHGYSRVERNQNQWLVASGTNGGRTCHMYVYVSVDIHMIEYDRSLILCMYIWCFIYMYVCFKSAVL